MPRTNNKSPENRPAEQQRGGLSQHHARVPSPHRGMMSPLGSLRAEFDRLFDNFFQTWPSRFLGEPQSRWSMDVQDRDDAIVVRAEAPGFEPNDFDIQVRDNQLMLCACKEAESKEEEAYEWEQRELYRSVPLPAGINADKVDAQYHNGVLTVTLPKTEKSKGRRIEVKG